MQIHTVDGIRSVAQISGLASHKLGGVQGCNLVQPWPLRYVDDGKMMAHWSCHCWSCPLPSYGQLEIVPLPLVLPLMSHI